MSAESIIAGIRQMIIAVARNEEEEDEAAARIPAKGSQLAQVKLRNRVHLC